jgi:5-methylcytosine-specific restriction protein B
LVRPDLFSFHHAPYQLAGHLIRLGLLPEEGRYLLDWQWRDLRLSDPDLSGLDPVLLMWAAYDEAGFGYGVSYWRVGTDVGTRPGETQVDCWPAMRQGGYAGVGWSSIGDLRSLLAGLSGDAAKARLREVLAQLQSYEPSVLTKSVNQLYSFYAEMKPGDRIAAMKGQRLLGVGRVQGDYYHEFENPQPHRRTVEWLIYPEEPWRDSPGLRTSVYNLTARYPQATLKIEQLVAGREPPRPLSPPPAAATPLTELESWIRSILVRKGQVILYGPPGTGKTFHARRAAQEIVARELFSGRSWAQLCPEEQQQVEGRMTFCTFHPAYAYEEFIEGYRPVITERGPSYVREDGLFLKACARARAEAGCPHVLILDEINRGNVAAVMGELITLLEADKRETLKVRLPLSGAELTVPRNLWIIGTMNTADRSISLLDAALRRRFGFIELMPEPERLDTYVDRLHLSALLTALNRRIREHVPRNARELQVGHAYFMRDGQPLRTKLELLEIFRDDVIPLLAEYCFESYTTLQEILGEDLVDVEKQVVRREALRDPERLHRCLLSLLSLDPEGWVEGDEATVDISLGVTADEDQGLTGASDSGEENAA